MSSKRLEGRVAVSATLEVEPGTRDELDETGPGEAHLVSGATYDVNGGDSANNTA